MKREVLIAGAGQLGSRYLQGLSAIGEPLEIWVYDSSKESLARAQQRWNETQPVTAHEVHYLQDTSGLPKNIDLTIVATTADVRTAVVSEICQIADVRFWVLEKVLGQSPKDVSCLQDLLRNADQVWVNTPRHQWALYRSLRRLYTGSEVLEACFEGFNGLASNSIHFVDLVCRWNGTKLIEVDVSALGDNWYESKRSGFYEVEGNLDLSFADGSRLWLGSQENCPMYSARLKIGHDEWNIDESDGIAMASDGRIVKGSTGLQSQLTAPMVEAIFSGVSCGLPTLDESVEQHVLFLEAMLDHWNSCMPHKVERLPIT